MTMPKKNATHETFSRLIQMIEKRAKEVNRLGALPEKNPVVLMIDIISSHIEYDKLEEVENNQ